MRDGWARCNFVLTKPLEEEVNKRARLLGASKSLYLRALLAQKFDMNNELEPLYQNLIEQV